MFSDQKRSSVSKNKRKGASASNVAVTILTSGCHFEGKLYCKGASRIGGQVQGKVISEGLLIVEEEARVEADMVVDEIIVLGQICGKLRASKRIELCENSRFEGEIVSPALVVKEGAQFNGQAMTTKTVSGDLSAVEHDDAVQEQEPQLTAADTLPSGEKMPDVTIVNSA